MFGKKEKPEKKEGFIKRLRARINKGDSWLTYDLANLAPGGKIDEDTLEELESLLVMADVGVDTTERIIADLHKRLARKELKDIDALERGLRDAICEILAPVEQPLTINKTDGPYVILMVGVNGAGKTTTIGKLARRLKDQGYSVMLAAGGADRRDLVREHMAAAGVQTSMHYPPAHRFQIYAGQAPSLPQTDSAAAREITLPMYGCLTRGEVDRVCDALLTGLEQAS